MTQLKMEKEGKTKPKIIRRKEFMNNIGEINEIETTKTL